MVPGGLSRAQLFTTWVELVEQNSGETLDLIPKVRLVGYTQKVGVKPGSGNHDS